MNHLEPIEFRKVRNFSEVLGVTFRFFRQNFRKLVSDTLLVTLPFLVLISILGIFFFQNALTLEESAATMPDLYEKFWALSNYYFLYVVVFLFYSVMVIAYMILYMDRGYDQFDWEDTLRLALRRFGKALAGTVITVIFVVVAMAIFILPGIYVAVPLSFLLIVIYREEIGVFAAISRCFEIVSGHWWVTFALLLVLGLIVNMFSVILSLPQMVLSTLVGMNTLDGVRSGWWVYVTAGLNLMTLAGNFLLYSLTLIGLAFQYFSLVEQKEMPGLLARIESIERSENTGGNVQDPPTSPQGEPGD